jgi:hypothetical protein
MMADRAEYVLRFTEVKHIAKPYGPKRDNPPDLWDFRKFVEACEGLPDTLPVEIKTGASDQTGRKDIMFSVRLAEPVTDEMVEERARSRGWFRRE